MSSRVSWSALVASAIAGVLFALAFLSPLAALADDAGAPFMPPTAEEFLARGLLAALLIGVAVRFIREWVPQLADGSMRAKRLTGLLCIALGVVFGLAGVAPAVAAGIAGQVLGGFGTGGIAYFGAGVLGSRGRLESEPTVGAQS